jgi:hypothetical protein
MKTDHAAVRDTASLGLGLDADSDRLNWRCRLRLDLFDPNGDWYDYQEHEGNLVTGAGANSLFSGLCTAGLATPFNAANAQIAVGDGSTAAKPGDTDLGAAAGATMNSGDPTAATNASPIVITVPSWTTTPVVGQVVIVAGINGNTAADGTFEVSAVTSTTVTLLNSSGNGAFSTSAGATIKPINKYRQGCSAVNVDPAVGGGISGATNATPIVITTTSAHGLADGQIVQVASVGGNTAANGTFYAKVTGFSSTTFGLYTDKALTNGVAGNGAYTSGGTVNLLGGVQFVGTFQPANGNFAWNEFGITTGGGATNKQATPPPTLLNHAISTLITKTSAASVAATITLSIN